MPVANFPFRFSGLPCPDGILRARPSRECQKSRRSAAALIEHHSRRLDAELHRDAARPGRHSMPKTEQAGCSGAGSEKTSAVDSDFVDHKRCAHASVYAAIAPTPQRKSILSRSRWRARYTRVSTAFSVNPSKSATSRWLRPSMATRTSASRRRSGKRSIVRIT